MENKIVSGIEVPTVEMRGVLVRDAHHKGTVVTLVSDDTNFPEFLFADMENGLCAIVRRVVAVQLAAPEVTYEEVDGERIERVGPSWHELLPEGSEIACDVDNGSGIALIGLDDDIELDESVGLVVWDSAAAGEVA